MNGRFLATLTILTGLLTLLAGCEKGPIGIFASIEQEELIKKGNLSEDAVVVGMTRHTDDRYYAALGGGIYYRDAASSGSNISWNGPVNHPADFGDYAKVTDMVVLGTDIYVSYVSDGGNKYGLFSLDTTDPANLGWSANLYSAQQITRLHAIDNNNDGITEELFASVGASSNYALVHAPHLGSRTTVVSGFEIIDGAFDGSNYVFISRAAVFSSDGVGPPFSADQFEPGDETQDEWPLSNIAGATNLAGIFYDAPDYYISSSDGELYHSSDGGTSWSDNTNLPSDGSPTDFASFPQLDGGVGGVVVGLTVQGDSSGGYLELPNGGVDTVEEPDGNNYVSAGISDAAVNEFYVDTSAEPDLLFALTGGTGLWRARYADDSGTPQAAPFWSWE